MKHITILILITIFSLGCQKNKSSKENAQTAIRKDSISDPEENLFPIIINKEKKYENKGFIDLRKLGNVEYIKLETNNDCLLPGKMRFQGASIDEDNIFISIDNERIFRFSKKGKFINSIGRKGQGPEEFLSLSDFKINETTKNIFILDHVGRRILSFDYNGTFQKAISIEKYCSNFDIVENDIILCFNNIDNNRPIIFSISNTSGKIISEIVPVKKETTGPKALIMGYYLGNKIYNNKYIYNTFITDTVFCIDKKTLKVEPRYIQIPPNTGIGEGNSIPFLIFETNKYANIYIYSGIPKIKETHIIDKKTNQIYTGFFADFERGTAAMPINTNKDNVLVDLYEASGLKRLLSNGHLNGSLKEIAESLDDEDNPVLVIITPN